MRQEGDFDAAMREVFVVLVLRQSKSLLGIVVSWGYVSSPTIGVPGNWLEGKRAQGRLQAPEGPGLARTVHRQVGRVQRLYSVSTSQLGRFPF
jgi:hypothetical protein